MNKNKIGAGILGIAVALSSQVADAARVRLDFSGSLTDTSGMYTYGDQFSGHYLLNTDVPVTDVLSGAGTVTWHYYYGAIEEFQLDLPYNSISFTPGGSGYVYLYNDYYSSTTGNWYDRILTHFADAQATVGTVDWVQFDFQAYSSTGPSDALASDALPIVTGASNFPSFTGRISADGDPNIHFQLDSLELTPVPLPASGLLFATGLVSLLFARKNRSA